MPVLKAVLRLKQMKEVLSILLGIGLLSLILIPGLVNKKNEEPSTNVDLEEKESITPAPVTNIKPDYELFMCLGVNNGMPVEPRTDFSTIDKIHCLIRW